ncbi:MAG: hypothetical protein ABJN69_08080 [Hellea sp.]
MPSDKYLEKAKAQLSLRPIFELNGADIQIVLILDQSPPLDAYWYKGKQAHIIAVDVEGNFFLRQSSGVVKYWVHKTKSLENVSLSVKDFVAGLGEDTSGIIGRHHA